jgi:DNA mismatch endonuclease, patch repair protein
MIVRRIAHRLGYRYRLHVRNLPGRPDLVFPRLRKIINVHGCYWHLHACRWGNVVPRTNSAFWRIKRMGNVTRDRRNNQALCKLGWRVLTVWECQLTDREQVANRIAAFLGV